MGNVVWLRPPEPEPGRPCLVHSDDQWWEGTVVWEEVRREDGLWWGAATYLKNGEEVAEVFSQHDLRAR
ncbi:hypothetical protein [Lentzea sp. CA-135723]|uniref:hypothetical protein n=1 Tax=Lentzea sp. CA-135723 TaxID=3239950 RepID=UPI003D8B7D8C